MRHFFPLLFLENFSAGKFVIVFLFIFGFKNVSRQKFQNIKTSFQNKLWNFAEEFEEEWILNCHYFRTRKSSKITSSAVIYLLYFYLWRLLKNSQKFETWDTCVSHISSHKKLVHAHGCCLIQLMIHQKIVWQSNL